MCFFSGIALFFTIIASAGGQDNFSLNHGRTDIGTFIVLGLGIAIANGILLLSDD